MRISLASIDIEWEDKEKNFLTCLEVVKQSSKEKVDLVIFPEMSLTGFSMNTAATVDSPEKFDTIRSFQELSATYRTGIIFGMVVEKNQEKYNNSFFIDREGGVSASYSKIHPFTFGREHEVFTPGSEISTVEFDGHVFGLSICYDLRFPEIYSAMANRAQIIINIANWPEKRVNHWHSLLASRAIENQIFMVGVNRTGSDPLGNVYEPSSKIVDPSGRRLEPSHVGQKFEIFEIDFDAAREYISHFPTRADRNNRLYKKIL